MKKKNVNRKGSGKHIFMMPAIILTKESTPEEVVKAFNENQTAIENQIKALKDTDLKSLIEANKALEEELKSVKGIITADQFKTLSDTNTRLEKAMQTLGGDVTKLKESGIAGAGLKGVALFDQMLHKALSENFEKIKGVKNGGSVKFSIGFNSADEEGQKDAATITSSNFGTGVLQGLRLGEVEDLDRNADFILSLVQVINGGPGSDPFSWVEKVVGEGGAASVAEGGAKPFYDFDYVENKVTAEVIAAIVPVSKQALARMPRLMSDIQTELMAELREEIQRQILLGTGASNEIKGIDYYATNFAAGGLAGTVKFANDFDVVRAVRAQIRRSKGKVGKLVILVSPDRAASMDLKKTETEGLYLMPPFSSAEGTIIKGVYVMECDDITDDDLFYAGDFSKYMFNIVEGITIEVGYINDQFQKNQLSIRAEIFAAGGVKAQHYNKLITGDFTSAKAALELVPVVL